MLRSIRSAPASAAIAAAERITSGSWPKSWIETGLLVGVDAQQLAQRALVAVVEREARDHLRDREPGAVALGLQAHEPVADPGQRREQHPVGELDAADREGVGEGRLGHGRLTSIVPLPDQPQAGQGEQVVDLVDRLAEGDDRVRRGRRWRSTSARRRAPPRSGGRSPSTSPAKPKIDAGLDRAAGRLADRGRRARRARSAAIRAPRSVSASIEISTPGRDHPAEVLALGRDGVEVDRRCRSRPPRRRRRTRS